MTPQQIAHLTARHAVFVTTAGHMQHPKDNLAGWRRDWAKLNELVEEINRMLRVAS
jgi:hypothetical protein